MANTLHRTDSRGDAYSVKRLLGDMFDLSPEIALSLSTMGKLGYTLAFMIEQKAKRAATDKKAASLRDSMQSLQDTITEKVTPVMTAMSSALPEGQSVDVASFRLLCANMVCQQELAESVVLEGRLNSLALAWKDTTILEAINVLMGNETGKSDFPLANTVYIVCDKGKQWTPLAFVFDQNRDIPRGIYVQNGESWDVLDYDVSNPIAYKFFTSKRALLKFAYAHTFLSDRIPSMLEGADENYNPFGALTPKTTARVDTMSLDDWSKTIAE